MKTSRVLLIDDDADLCQAVNALLTQHGFIVDVLHDSKNIEAYLKEQTIDLILLDIILPSGKDGIATCKIIRQYTNAPIIMLTGIGEDLEKILSLEVGADHYITKPFNSRILLAYINACLRREDLEKININKLNESKKLVENEYQLFEFSGWRLNSTSRVLLSPANCRVKLTSMEFMLLYVFVQHPQQVLSRDKILDLINMNSSSFDRSIDILISRLRSKMGKNRENYSLITTVRNEGYILTSLVKKEIIDTANWKNILEEIK